MTMYICVSIIYDDGFYCINHPLVHTSNDAHKKPLPRHHQFHRSTWHWDWTCCCYMNGTLNLLMEEIRLTSWYGKYPMIYRVLAPSQVVLAGFLNHQQWNHSQFHLSTVTLETNTFLSHFLQHFSKEKGLMKVHAASTVPMGWNQIFDLPACMTKFAIKNQPFVDSGKFTPVPFPCESVMQVWNPEISSFIARFHCSDLSQIFRKIH